MKQHLLNLNPNNLYQKLEQAIIILEREANRLLNPQNEWRKVLDEWADKIINDNH